MKFKLNPYIGVSDLEFGMKKDDIKNILKVCPKTFEKTKNNFIDDFKILHVEYNNKKSISFEIFLNENYLDVDVEFMGISFSKTKKEELKNFFIKYDKDIEIDFYGFTSYKYGFSVYSDLEEDLVTSVFIFEKDYYKNY